MPDELTDAIEAFAAMIREHEDCIHRQVGRCVYCADHQVRLYEGYVRVGHNDRVKAARE
jgi:hypothetical protein